MHLCAGVRYNEFGLYKKERLIYYPVFRICKIQLPRVIGSTLTLGIIISLSKDMIYLNAWAIVCCLVVGIAEPWTRQHSIVPTLFPFNNRLLLGNSGQENNKYEKFELYHCMDSFLGLDM